MGTHEERIYRIGKIKPSIAVLKTQLAELKRDLAHFGTRTPNGSLIAPLQGRIRAVEAEIAEAEADRDSRAQASRRDVPSAQEGDRLTEHDGLHATRSRFPTRGRPRW